MNKIAVSIIVLIIFAAAEGLSASVLHDFTSDGCTLFPDGTMKDRDKWCECCLEHDIAYWKGGTKDDRLNADKALRQCVQERTGNKKLATLMYDGVRAGGHPAFPTWYRWAYGWNYGRGYKPLSEREKEQVRMKLDAYRAAHPRGYCHERHEGAK